MRLIIAALFALLAPLAAATPNYVSYVGSCQQGGYNVVTQGLSSSTVVQASFPQCKVSVSVHGGGSATLFSDKSGTPLSNPFCANTDGSLTFYVDTSVQGIEYDITLSSGSPCSGGPASPFTLSDVFLGGGGGGGGGGTPGGSLGTAQANGPGLTFAGEAGIIYADQYSGADMCAKINAAALANTVSTIDARSFVGNQACGSNPFTTLTHDIVLLLGEGVVIQTTVPWVTNSGFNALIYGSGRGSSNRGTTIQAVSGFPSTCDSLSVGCPVLRLGNGAVAFGQRFENASIDCNNQSGCIGIYSNGIEEQSGLYHFTVLNFPVYGVFMDGTPGPGIGAQNYVLSDGEVYSGTAGTSSTIGVYLKSSIAATNGPRLVESVTSNGDPLHIILSGFTLQAISTGALIGNNAESATSGYTIEPNGGSTTQSVTMINSQCNLIVSNCIWLQAPLNDINIFNVLNNPGSGTPVTIRDATSGLTYSDFSIDHYAVADAQGFRLNSASGGLNIFQSLALGALGVSNQADSILQVDFDSGKTASQGQALLLSDRGTNKWNITDSNIYDFFVFDYTNSFTRLRLDHAGNDVLNSIGSQPVEINVDTNAGTGGIEVFSGGATPQIVAQFSPSVPMRVPGLAGIASYCLQVDTTGLVTNTGSPCGTGGGGGTVNSGPQYQIGIYPNSGTNSIIGPSGTNGIATDASNNLFVGNKAAAHAEIFQNGTGVEIYDSGGSNPASPSLTGELAGYSTPGASVAGWFESSADYLGHYALAGSDAGSPPVYLGTATGTNNYISAFPLHAYAAGQTFCFLPQNTSTSTAVSLNVNSLGAKTILSGGNLPLVGQLVANHSSCVQYNGTTLDLSGSGGSGGATALISSVTSDPGLTPGAGGPIWFRSDLDLLRFYDGTVDSKSNAITYDSARNFDQFTFQDWKTYNLPGQLAKIDQGITGSFATIACIGDSHFGNAYGASFDSNSICAAQAVQLQKAPPIGWGYAGLGWLGNGAGASVPTFNQMPPNVTFSRVGSNWGYCARNGSQGSACVSGHTWGPDDTDSTNTGAGTLDSDYVQYTPGAGIGVTDYYIYYLQKPGGGTIDPFINGSAQSGISTAGSLTFASSHLSLGGELLGSAATLKLAAKADGSITILGVLALDSTNPGVVVLKLGCGGEQASMRVALGTAGLYLANILNQLNTDIVSTFGSTQKNGINLFEIEYATNEYEQNVPPSTLATNVDSIINSAKLAVANADIFFFSPPDNSATGGCGGTNLSCTTQQYDAAMETNIRQQGYGFFSGWKNTQPQTGLAAQGLYDAANIHLNFDGVQMFANKLDAAILQGARTTTPLSANAIGFYYNVSTPATTYTVLASDFSGPAAFPALLTCGALGGCTDTLPASGLTPSQFGAEITFMNTNTGTLTIAAGSGTSLNGPTTAAQFERLVVIYTASNAYRSFRTPAFPIARSEGGTGIATSTTDGQLLIGNTATGNWTKAALTAGSNITITNGNGSISIASSAGGSVGSGVSGYSASALTLTGTQYIPLDGGASPTTTEANVQQKVAVVETIGNQCASIPALAGGGNVVFSLQANGSPAGTPGTVTMTVNSSSGVCDTTNSYTTSVNDLLDWKLGTTGTVGASLNVQVGGQKGTGGITGSGSTNKLTKFTSSTGIGNSGVSDNGTTVSTTENVDLSGASTTAGFKPPAGAGAAPTTAGVCSFDTTQNRQVCGDGSTTQTYVTKADVPAHITPISTTWTSSTSANTLLGSPITLLTSPATGFYNVFLNASQSVSGTGCSPAGSVQFELGYVDPDSGLTCTLVNSGNTKCVMLLLAGSLPTATMQLQASITSNPNNSVANGQRPIRLMSGTNLTFQAVQTTADSGCSTHAQVVTTVTVQGPFQ